MEVTNRFKGLDLIDRVPDELWTEVLDIVQETGDHPHGKDQPRQHIKKQRYYSANKGLSSQRDGFSLCMDVRVGL